MDHAIECATEVFNFAIAFASLGRRWLVPDVRRLEDWCEVTVVLSSAIDVELLGLHSRSVFNLCEILVDVF